MQIRTFILKLNKVSNTLIKIIPAVLVKKIRIRNLYNDDASAAISHLGRRFVWALNLPRRWTTSNMWAFRYIYGRSRNL